MPHEQYFAKRTRDHYNAHGRNAHYVAEQRYTPSRQTCEQITRVGFRKGRDDEGEAVQMQINIDRVFEKRTVNISASISFDQKTWDAIVEFVKTNNTVTR